MMCPIKLIILSVYIATSLAQTQINDECSIPGGKQGKCVRLANCPSAVEAVIKNEKPVNCGFEGIHPIVCCETEKKVGEIAKQKCLKYSQMIITDSLAKGSKESAKIELNVEEYPYMAALGYGINISDITWRCGGTLISEKYVLTAAQCIQNPILEPIRIVGLGDPTQNLKVVRVFIHPEFKHPSVYNDIALLELSSDVVFNKYVQPACLQTVTEITGSYLGAIGWGFSKELSSVPMKSFTSAECQKTYSSTTKKLKNGIDSNTQLCAGVTIANLCNADSGSPLKVEDRLVIGVTSFAKSCGIEDVPTVYTKVSHYIGWIESIVWP